MFTCRPAIILALALCCLVSFQPAQSSGRPGAAFFEPFTSGWETRWQYSTNKKYGGRFQVVQPPGFQDAAIQMPTANQHYGLTAVLDKPLQPTDGLVVQYEVKFAQGHKCGGAYLKLLSQPEGGARLQPETLKSTTPFTLMFGPDRCGPDARVHVILHTHNPATGNTTEHHLLSAPPPKEDLLSHVYALLLHSNGRFKVLIDGLEAAAGDLMTAKFNPPLQPPEHIPDPDHTKPDDWVEEDKMDDPSAVKPQDWDDRRFIPDPHAHKPDGWLDTELPEVPDPTAVKPADWDEASQGVWLPPPVKNPACLTAPGCGPWKPPLVSNPQYKGPWIPPQVKNPAYKGPWQQRQIPNLAYFKVINPLEHLAPVAAVAFELWTTDSGYTFDSVMLGAGDAGIAAAAAYMKDTWRPRNRAEVAAFMAAERAKSRPAGARYWAANTLQDILDAPALSVLRPHLGPAVLALQEHPALGWVVLLVPGVLLGALLADRLTQGRQAAAAHDSGEEDEQQEAEELEVDDEELRVMSQQAAALQKQHAAAAAAAARVPQAKQQQVLEEQQAEGGHVDADNDAEPSVEQAPLKGGASATSRPRRRVTSRKV